MIYTRSMALVIGLDNYQFQPRQPGAVRNADGMASCLRWTYKFEVSTLMDQQATRGAVSRELTRLQDADRLVIYYAGRALDSNTLCLFSTQAEVSNSGLTLDRLIRQLDALPVRHILLILDATIEQPAFLEALPTNVSTSDARFEQKARLVIASGPTAFTLRERWGDEDATPFTAQVIHGLKGAAANVDGLISGELLAAHVAHELPRNSNGRQGMWVARLPGADGDILFRTHSPPELPYDIETGLRSGSPFHRYRAVELLAWLVDRADPILSVRAIDKLRELAVDNDSANVRKMAADELIVRQIDPHAHSVPALREPAESRSGGVAPLPVSTQPAPALPGDRRQTWLLISVIIGVFVIVLYLITHFH